jgi:hypothetical protein
MTTVCEELRRVKQGAEESGVSSAAGNEVLTRTFYQTQQMIGCRSQLHRLPRRRIFVDAPLHGD